jgi:hypothetical protein
MLFFVAAGLLLLAIAGALDFIVRLRLRGVGEKAVFWQGGTLDYSKYLKQCKRDGWSPLPVYLIFPMVLAGAASLIFGLFRSR